MLHRDILISQSLRLTLRADQDTVTVAADINLPIAALHLDKPLDQLLAPVCELLRVNPHLLDQLRNQRIVQRQQRIKQMLLPDLLIAILIRQLLTVIHGLHRILCEFLNIHNIKASSYCRLLRGPGYCFIASIPRTCRQIAVRFLFY